jgi:hypothetical protein
MVCHLANEMDFIFGFYFAQFFNFLRIQGCIKR